MGSHPEAIQFVGDIADPISEVKQLFNTRRHVSKPVHDLSELP